MATLAASIIAGAFVSYTAPGTTDVQCLEVRSLTTDWGQTPMAWLTVVADPRRVIHAPLHELTPGCPTLAAASRASTPADPSSAPATKM